MTRKLPGLGAPLEGNAPLGTAENPHLIHIQDPLVIIFRDRPGDEPDSKLICRLHPYPGDDHRTYGLIACDLVRHVARMFNVPEDAVWEWVDKERARPTTPVTGGMVS
jgi:hypothetical protein